MALDLNRALAWHTFIHIRRHGIRCLNILFSCAAWKDAVPFIFPTAALYTARTTHCHFLTPLEHICIGTFVGSTCILKRYHVFQGYRSISNIYPSLKMPKYCGSNPNLIQSSLPELIFRQIEKIEFKQKAYMS